jgi:multidrug efflux pump subunit AcrA (membrane-fusion protein)
MKRIKFNFHLLIIVIMISGCGVSHEKAEKEVIPKVPVTVTAIRTGPMTDYAQLNATSVFFNKSIIKSPMNGYIENISINPGDWVKKNQKIITLRTRESAALKSDSANPVTFSGLIFIRSVIDGVVISVDHPVGDYVQEGDQMITIANPENLVFILEAPFDLNPYIKVENRCQIVLPDSTKIEARIKSQLASMSGVSQTQRFVIVPTTIHNLPENLIARIRIPKKSVDRAVILPKSCVLTDEVMRHFWVMKLINDSTAVKVPVKTGLSTGDSVQIIEPHFSETDLILTSGNYGVGDTVLVNLMEKK